MNGLQLQLDVELLRPIIRSIVAEVVAALEQDRVIVGDKLAFSEPEAARLLSLHVHQLRDERRRGRIGASTGPGRKVLYAKQDLLDYLAARRRGQTET